MTNMVSRRQFLASSAALTVSAAAFSFGRQATAATNWDMPAAYSGSNYVSKNYVTFAELVKAKTNGAVNITVHPGGSLYGGSEILRAVREDQVPIGARFLAAESNQAPILGIDTIPFLATNREQAWKLYQASKPEVQKVLAGWGLLLLYAPVWPPQGLFSKNKVTSVDDMKGVRFRAYDTSTTRLAELMGAIPTKTEASEIAQAFSTGMAEAMTASGAIGVFQKMWDYVDYFYRINAWLPKSGVIVNLNDWNKLGSSTRETILKVAATAESKEWNEMEVQNAHYNKVMAEHGIHVEEPSAELKTGLEKIGRTMTQEWIKANGKTASKVIAAYRAS